MKILTHCNAGWLAFVDIGQAYGEDGQLLPWELMPEDVRRAVAAWNACDGIETAELEAMNPGTFPRDCPCGGWAISSNSEVTPEKFGC